MKKYRIIQIYEKRFLQDYAWRSIVQVERPWFFGIWGKNTWSQVGDDFLTLADAAQFLDNLERRQKKEAHIVVYEKEF